MTRQAAWSIAIKGLYTLVTPFTVIFLARILGPEQYGVYAFTISVVTLLSVPAGFGFPNVIIRYAANYHYRRQWEQMKGLFRFTNGMVMVISLLLMGLVLLFTLYEHTGLDPDNRKALRLALPLILVLGLESLRASALKGIDQVVLGQLPDFIVRPVLFLMLIAAGYFLLDVFEARTGLTLYLIAATVSYVFGAWLLLRCLPGGMRKAKTAMEVRPWLNSALPLLVLGSVQVIGGQIDVIILGLFRTNHEVGVYSAVFQTSLLVIFGWSAVNSVLAPKIANLFLVQKKKELTRLISAGNWSIFLMGLPVALVFLVWGKPLLQFVFGAEFAAGFTALTILMAGRLVNALFGSSSTILKMTGFERIAAVGITAGTLVNVLLNFLLIPPFGIEGAAIASSAGIITWCALLILQVNRKLALHPLSVSIFFEKNRGEET